MITTWCPNRNMSLRHFRTESGNFRTGQDHFRTETHPQRNMEQMSEAEAKEILSRLESLEAEMYENKKELMRKLKAILPAKKIIRLKKAERDFNRKLMKQFRDKRGKRKSMP